MMQVEKREVNLMLEVHGGSVDSVLREASRKFRLPSADGDRILSSKSHDISVPIA